MTVCAARDNAVIEDERDIDLFAGAGGWDEGAAGLDIRPLGVEWDDAACATRRARGHETLQADVSQLNPAEFAPVRLMIASPPCQAFSMAGSGHARRALKAYVAEIRSMMAGHPIDRERLDRACSDERGHLVLEPLRWALAVQPRFIACENVDSVHALWEAMADALREFGYGTWAGMLSAEQYGVPQTRRRAFLLAKLVGEVSPPPTTHQRYIAPRVKAKQEESLFDAPEPERIVAAEDRELLPWVSMAEALGWAGVRSVCNYGAGDGVIEAGAAIGHRPTTHFDPENRPSRTVTHSVADWRPDDRIGFPRRNDMGTDAEYRERDFRSASEPAFTLTEKARSAIRMRSNKQPNAAVRSADEPAPTIAAGHSTGDRVWEADPPTHMNTGRDWKAGGSREDAQKIPTSEPSPAFTGKLGGQAQWVRARDDREGAPRDPDWPSKRPATTVAGAVRVSVQEAAVLQGFPPDYPWQGTRTAQYRQIGDAVPPPWARAILAHLLAP